MSVTLEKAIAMLEAKIGAAFDGRAKFVLTGAGVILLDPQGIRAEDGEADVTLTAEVETFRAILEGETNPTVAYMQGRLKVDGNMGLAMALGNKLA